jgi:WD40-like Beta Propeller Repeat
MSLQSKNCWTRIKCALIRRAMCALLAFGVTHAGQMSVAQSPLHATQPLLSDVVVFNSNHGGGNHEIYIMQSDGRALRQLTANVSFDASWPRVSPDRQHILFQRTPVGTGGSNYREMSLWMMRADGSGVHELRAAHADGWAMQGHTEWSPDGTRLIMFGGPKRHNPQLYVTDVDGNNPVAITARAGQNLDPSFSPDGKWIAFVGCPRAICFENDYEIYLLTADGKGQAIRVTDDKLRDHDPYFSPDSKSLAWLTRSSTKKSAGTWGIRLQALGTKEPPKWVIDDGHINSYPAWSKDGARIFFHRLVYGGTPAGFHLYSITPEGKNLTPLTTHLPGSQEYPNQ